MASGGTNPLELITLVIEPEIEKIRQHIWYLSPENIISPDVAAGLAKRNQRDYDAMETIAKRSGFNEDQFRMLVDSLRLYVTPDVLTAATFRGIVTPERRDELLGVLGYADEERKIITESAIFIPPVQDLVRFALRDVFTPAIVNQFHLRDNFPPAFAENAKKLGMTEEIAQWYWMAHWDLPSTMQGFEMLQRNVIERSDLEFLFQANDVMPFWREKLLEIAYNPLTRVDIRRIHKLLGKDRSWLVSQYKSTGYNADNAETLAVFTEEYNKKERKLELKDITDGLKSRVIGGVMSGSLKEIDGRDLLTGIGYDAKEIAAFLTEAHLFRTDRHLARLAQLAGDLYVKGRLTKLETTTKLRESGFGDEEMALQFREWDMEIALHAPDERQLKDRDLTKAEIITAYEDGIFSKDEASASLKLMRYDAKEIATMVAISDFKVKVREDRDAIEVIHQKFLSGAYDETTAGTELDKYVKHAGQKVSLLLKWIKEHKTKTADIPLSSVQELFQREISTKDWTENYLKHMGFDTDERGKLLALWGDRAAEKKARDVAATAKKSAKSGKGTGTV